MSQSGRRTARQVYGDLPLRKCRVDTVEEGQTLLRIHASSQKALKEAVAKLNKMSSIVRKWSEASW